MRWGLAASLGRARAVLAKRCRGQRWGPQRVVYNALSRNAVSWDFDSAPVLVATA